MKTDSPQLDSTVFNMKIEAFLKKSVWKIGVMMLPFAVLLTLLSCEGCQNFSQGDSMPRDENVLHQNSNQKITLTGVAHDKKGGAILITDDGRVITIGGLDAWPEGFSAEARVEATGFLKTIEMPQAEGYDESGHPTGGAVSQGYPQKTKVTVLNLSTWKRIDTNQTPPQDQTIEFVLPLGFVHEGQGTPVLDPDFNPMTLQNLPVIFDGDPQIFLNKLSSPDIPKQIITRAGVHFEKKTLHYRLGASEETGSRSVYVLIPKTVIFAKPATKPPEHQHNMPLNKSASPELDFMAGPALTDTKTIENWIREQSAHPARQVRIPVTLEWDGISWQRANLSHLDRDDLKIPLALDDTRLGISLADKLAQLCGSAQTACALWLNGQFPKGDAAPWPFVISKVHGLQSKGER